MTFVRGVTLGTILKSSALFVVFSFILWYIHFQARDFIYGPRITIENGPQSIQTTPTITLRGTAENIVLLTINGREVHTDTNGVFENEVILQRGYSIVTLFAKDRFQRSTTLTREFVRIK